MTLPKSLFSLAALLLPLALAGCLGASSAPSGQPAAPRGGDGGAIERTIQEEVNDYRRAKGMTTLADRSELSAFARAHSIAMASSNRLSHDGFNDRLHSLRTAGFATASENVAYSRGHADVATTAVGNWRNSPGHLRNMTNGGDRFAGVGVAFAADGSAYVTMLYGR